MQTIPFYGAAPLLAAVAYLGASALAARALRAGTAVRIAGPGGALLALAVLAHAAALAGDVFGSGGLRFGFAQALSATFLAAGAMLLLEGLAVDLGTLALLLAPAAAVAALLPLAFHGVPLAFESGSFALRLHLGVSMLAYSLFTLAALHCFLMSAVDRRLHRPGHGGPGGTLLARMPSLLALEALVFRQLAFGFILLTASLASGIAFSEQLFGRPMRLDHKTVFATLAWLVFAGLLAGRHAFGWRGRVAQRGLFTGFAMLLLAYVGSRFVFEVVLGRGWV
jgi:ABC-type uncharacterized transport system permease subunit